jgi:hypothetical protein
MKKTKLRKKVLPSDLKESDLDLLFQAYHLAESHSLCFGNAYYRLKALDLINCECKITYYGKQLVRYVRV